MSTPNTTLVTVAAVTVLGGLFAYAVYFDHKRRNDIEFRKNLRKEQKRVRKAKDQVAAAAPSSPSGPVTDAVIQAALDALKAEPLPNSTQEREAYFSEHISNGELLSQRGPPAYLEAALAFYRGLRVYPAPLELIMIYQKTVPEPIFNILMKLTTFEVKRRAEAYYEHFPPKSMNVEVKQVPVDDSPRGKVLKNVLVATKDFAVGETIYTEFPMASALDMDLEGKGTHCSQCMRSLSGVTALTLEDDPLGVAYCSPGCKAHANDQHHSLLFSLEPVPVLGFDDVPAPGPRRAAQAALAEHLKKSGISRSLVALRLFTHQTMSDTQKALRPLDKPQSVLPEPDAGTYGSDYTFGDHLERLRFLEVHADDKEVKFSKAVLDAALNAGEELLTDEQYNTFKGKVAYNGIGVVYNGGRDRPRKNGTKEEDTFEWTRTPLGTQRQVGTALYRVSSYLTHSCTPSVRPTFPNGDYNLHLVASRSISKGEEITMAYVEVARQAGESAEECCFRRRKQLAVGWSFVCLCARCLEERPKPAAKKDSAKDKETKSADGSASEGEDGVLVPEHAATVKVEEQVQKFEEQAVPVDVAEAA